jgi:hypothetical protein
MARSAPRALDAASILFLQAHSGNAALAGLLGGDRRGAARSPASRAAAGDMQAGSPGELGAAGGTVLDLRDHPGFGDVQRAPGGSPGVLVQLQGAVLSPPPPVAAPPVEAHDGAGFQRTAVADAEAPPQGAEGKEDLDISEFTNEPQKAAAKLAAMPAPVKPAAPPPPVGATPPPLPAAPLKIPALKMLVTPPKPGPKAGQKPAPKAAGAVGEVIRKPVPPLPPTYEFEPGDLPPPPAAVVSLRPHEDPAFTTVVRAAMNTAKAARKHPSAREESAAAQGAAEPPANDNLAQAEGHRMETMATAKPDPKAFDEDAFVAAVEKAIATTAPKNLHEADDVEEKSKGVKDIIGAKVAAGKEAAAGDIDTKAKKAPDLSTAVEKPVTKAKPLQIAEPSGIKASAAMPAPAPTEQLDLRNGPAQIDHEMAEAGITEEQLAESNEPEFIAALDAKKAGEEHAAKAPGEVRTAEAAILNEAALHSAAAEKNAVGGARGAIGGAVAKVGGQKEATKSKDELKRKEVADGIHSIFDTTKKEVDEILGGLGKKVDEELFTPGEAAIREAFTYDWNLRLDDYKDRRYSGVWGKGRWLRDEVKGLPSEANKLYAKSRAMYEHQMHKLVLRIAQIVGVELKKATSRIEQGRRDVATYVGSQKGALAKFGQEAATDIADRFDDLDASVKGTYDDLADSLAKKYAESRNAVDEELKAAHKADEGLIDKGVDRVRSVIRTADQLKDLVLTVLKKIASVIDDIIHHPIRFLETFFSAVKGGITRFANKIGEHLQKGLMDWLLGHVDAEGPEIPKSFDVPSMLKLVLSVLHITRTTLWDLLGAKVGKKAAAVLLESSAIVQKLMAEGPAGLWEKIHEKFSEQFGDFKDMVLNQIEHLVEQKIVQGGIAILLPMLSPVTALIKACQMIYDVVMFFFEKGTEIAEFFETVVDVAGDCARGVTGGLVEKIEDCLARLLPFVIGFLASIAHVGDIGGKVASIIDRVSKPMHKAVGSVVDTVVNLTAPIWKPVKRGFDKAKVLYAGKAKAGKAWIKEKATAVAGFFSVKEFFSVEGERHSLYSTGASGRLMVASKKPTALADHPDAAVRRADATYRSAVDAAKTPNAKKKAAENVKYVVAAVTTSIKKQKEEKKAAKKTREPDVTATALVKFLEEVNISRFRKPVIDRRGLPIDSISGGTVSAVKNEPRQLEIVTHSGKDVKKVGSHAEYHLWKEVNALAGKYTVVSVTLHLKGRTCCHECRGALRDLGEDIRNKAIATRGSKATLDIDTTSGARIRKKVIWTPNLRTTLEIDYSDAWIHNKDEGAVLPEGWRLVAGGASKGERPVGRRRIGPP